MLDLALIVASALVAWIIACAVYGVIHGAHRAVKDIRRYNAKRN